MSTVKVVQMSPEMLNTRQLAKVLHVSRRTAERWASREVIPVVHTAHGFRFHYDEVADWVASHKEVAV